MRNTAEIQAIIQYPASLDMALLSASGNWIASMISELFDRGASQWQAVGTREHDGFKIANRPIHRSYAELLDALNHFPELGLQILAAQSFVNDSEQLGDDLDEMGHAITHAAPTVYKAARAADIAPYLNDVIEYDDAGDEVSRSRPVVIALPASVSGGAAWVFE